MVRHDKKDDFKQVHTKVAPTHPASWTCEYYSSERLIKSW